MDRSTVELRCPGTATNYTVLVGTSWQAKYGIGNPMNVGDCELFIVPLDQNGQPVDKGRHNVRLLPGQSLTWYFPPSDTEQIVAVCSKLCHARAVLEYDTPTS